MLGYTRQHYYKQGANQRRKDEVSERVRDLLLAERKQLPCSGGRKLYHLIRPKLQQQGIKCGRDRLFTLMRHYQLLIKPARRYVQTTNSRHWMRKFDNLVGSWRPTEPEQLWVSDITYIKTQQGTCYLSLVTDAYSRKIMGYSIADNMEAGTVCKALKMALQQRLYPQTALIHHSDRGIQYCSQEYVQLATSNGLCMSMTQNGDPYENALAERMNRTIKEEFCLNESISSKTLAVELVKEAVWLYNNRRPHCSLFLRTPEQEHKNPRLLKKAGDHVKPVNLF